MLIKNSKNDKPFWNFNVKFSVQDNNENDDSINPDFVSLKAHNRIAIHCRLLLTNMVTFDKYTSHDVYRLYC